MQKFYYTFGSDPKFPFQGGWVIIKAENNTKANEVFNALFPPREGHNGILNCAFVYTEEEFKETHMYKDNRNIGASCHGVFSAADTTKNHYNNYK